MKKLTKLSKSLKNAAFWIVQRILDEISLQVDGYEERYGPTDRSDFDGDFYVPTEVRNRINSAKGSLRIHGGLLTISRSRTFLSLSSNSRSSIHNSTPDLSRSVPNTPGSNHKISLTSSYDSVLEENEGDGVMVVKKGKGKNKKKNGKSQYSSLHHIFSSNNVNRRKSEDLLESRTSSSSNGSMITNKQQQHIRQSSDQAYRLIPRVKKSGFVDNQYQSSMAASELDPTFISERDANGTGRWGNVRGSNSFAGDLSISALSTYTIPRVSLSQHKIHETTNSSTQIPPKQSLPENQTSKVLMRHSTDDSIA